MLREYMTNPVLSSHPNMNGKLSGQVSADAEEKESTGGVVHRLHQAEWISNRNSAEGKTFSSETELGQSESEQMVILLVYITYTGDKVGGKGGGLGSRYETKRNETSNEYCRWRGGVGIYRRRALRASSFVLYARTCAWKLPFRGNKIFALSIDRCIYTQTHIHEEILNYTLHHGDRYIYTPLFVYAATARAR